MIETLLCVHGILAGISDIDWARAYCARFDNPPERTGEPYVYQVDVFGGMDDGSNTKFESEIADLIFKRNFANEPVDAAGHSHGVFLLLLAMLNNPGLLVRQLTLIGGAADPDCRRNGLNQIAGRGQVKNVKILWSPNDMVLAGPGLLPRYGQLGLKGPSFISPELAKILTPLEETRFDCGHCGYFDADNDARTYALATASATPEVA